MADRRSGDTTNTLLPPETRETLKHLELIARRTVEGMLHGMHKSKRKGVSTDFDHHKVYQPGDPIRHIDWKVSARSDNYFVKRYLEDTALSVRLVVDRSGSMLQTTADTSVFTQASKLAACLAYLVLHQHDRAGMILTSDRGTVHFPVRSTETHLVAMLKTLAAERPSGGGGLEQSLKTLLDSNVNKGLIPVISDFMFEPEPVQKQLSRLQAQGHEVLIFQLRDPTVENFPFNRWVQFQDLEVEGKRHRVDAVPLKKIYREEYQQLQSEWRSWARKHDIHFVSFSTEEQLGTILSDYIHRRGEVGEL